MARALAGLFCFTVALSWCVASADAYSVSIEGFESAAPGNILEVDIIMDSEDQTLYGYIMRVYFDPAVLSVVSGTYHPIAGEVYGSLYMYPDHWYVTMTSWVPAGPVNQSIATLVFHVMDVPTSTLTSIDPNVVTLIGHGGANHASTTTLVPLEIHVSDCGDGTIVSPEQCDDGGTAPGDGCDTTCQVETGWTCLDEPSVCSEDCGDGIIVGAELCDDDGTAPSDGCDATCQIETSWTCAGEPSVCTPCGDGVIEGIETCDDGGTASGDGCHASCQIESDWRCAGEPSACTKMLPALSPWSQVALVAGLLVTALGVWRRRGTSPSAA
jgi:cysteine-rich repeat protein